MPTLHLGVVEIPYENTAPPKKKGKKGKPAKGSKVVTTGDVADILEAKYHPYRIFFEIKQRKIAQALENSIKGALENVLMGAPGTHDPFAGVSSAIETMMKQFIATGQMEKLGFPGVPTQAALKGVNHRLLHPHAKDNPRRPSFMDTTLWQGSLKAWIE